MSKVKCCGKVVSDRMSVDPEKVVYGGTVTYDYAHTYQFRHCLICGKLHGGNFPGKAARDQATWLAKELSKIHKKKLGPRRVYV